MINNKYFIYARKSSESDERQIQSIDDQLNVMKKKAEDLGLEIVDILTESMSAKAPGRYRFNELMCRVESGEATGIIAWKLDRLSRNPIDSGKIQFMLQTGKLDRVITNDREYNPIDAGLLMSVENGMANQFLLDLSKNVKRGVQSKAERGDYPGPASIGYRNDLAKKTIIKDEESFLLVQRIWKLMITADYSVEEIRQLANEKWGLRTIKGYKLSKSSMYAIFNSVFYTGDFKWKGKIMNGNHPAMISYEEYNRVQELLGQSGKPKLVKHDFAYTGMLRCGECESMVTAGNKSKYIKTTNSIKNYSYYWCTKKVKSKTDSCSQKAIRKEALEEQIDSILISLEIIPEFKEWAVKAIQENYKDTIEEREGNVLRLQKEQQNAREKLDKLTDMLLEGRITDSIFDKRSKSLELEIKQLDKNLGNIDDTRKNKLESMEEMFHFVSTARESFKIGDFKTKKGILRNLGLDFTLKDGVLALELHPYLQVIKDHEEIQLRQKGRFAPIKNSTSTSCTDTIDSVIPIWQGPQELHLGLSGSESDHSSN